MTTFQAFIYAVIQGATQFAPVSAKAHQILLPYVVGWQPPTGALLGALNLGAFLACLIYFRHDWASMISSLIQVIAFRRRPMTMDERMPLFITISSVPTLLALSYFGESLTDTISAPLGVTAIFAAVALPLWICDSWSKKCKGMADWNWLDALWIGLSQTLAILPGYDFFTGALFCGFFLNYRREAAAKYAFFTSVPVLLTQSITLLKDVNFHAQAPMPEMTWLTFSVALVVTLLMGVLVIGGFMKNIAQKNIGQYVAYRWVMAALVCVVFWIRNR